MHKNNLACWNNLTFFFWMCKLNTSRSFNIFGVWSLILSYNFIIDRKHGARYINDKPVRIVNYRSTNKTRMQIRCLEYSVTRYTSKLGHRVYNTNGEATRYANWNKKEGVSRKTLPTRATRCKNIVSGIYYATTR